MILLTCLLWLFAAGMTWWVLARQPAPAPARPQADPHAGEFARFRRQLHDWDRRA
jgi:hypothetical protein